MLLRKYQCAALWVDEFVTVKLAALTALPDCHQLVVLLPGCDVMEFVVWPSFKYIVTVTMLCGLILKFNGSDTASAPFGIDIDSLPENVIFCRVEGCI